jgi:hypothetical protein
MRHSRRTKRAEPSTPSSDHSSVSSGGALNIMNTRTLSAPKRSTRSVGSTPLPFDFDIVRMPSQSTGLPSLRSVALTGTP